MTRANIALVLSVAAVGMSAACASEPEDDGRGGAGTGAGTSGAGSAGMVAGVAGASSGSSGTSGAGAGGAAGSAGSSGMSAGASGSSGASAGSDAGSGANDGGLHADGGSEAGSTNEDPCDTALLCESFESYTTGQAPSGNWEPRTGSGAVSVVEDRSFVGVKAARFTTEAGSGGKTAFIRLQGGDVFPVTGNAYFGRMMIWLESAPEESVHWTFIQSTGTVPGEAYRATYRYGGQHPVTEGPDFVGNQLMANYETPDSYSGNGPGSDCWLHAEEKVVPVGRWACVEWQFDGPNDTMRLWLDGEALDDLTMEGTGQGCVHQGSGFAWTAPTFGDLEIGWESYQPDDARTLYIDEVVLHERRTGCPASR